MIVREIEDAPINNSPYILTAGDVFEGSIHVSGDTDFVGLQMVAGQTYTVSFEPARYQSSLSFGVYDLDGFVARAFGDRTVFMTYTALETGVHYVSPTFGGSAVGGYSVAFDVAQNTKQGTIAEVAEYIAFTYWDDANDAPGKWALDASRTITVDLSTLNSDGQDTARLALSKWAEVGAFTFVETTQNADINFGFADYGAFAALEKENGVLTRATVAVEPAIANGAHAPGTLGFTVFLHEIGHALGLGHPGNYNLILPENPQPLFQNDTTAFSVLSYFQAGDVVQTRAAHGFEPHGPMLADIEALHLLYGDVPLNTGNTVYQLRQKWQTEASALAVIAAARLPQADDIVTMAGSRGIVDDGGIDTLDLSQALGVRVIDLEPHDSILRVDRNGGLFFSPDTIIENVIGAGGIHATIRGNAADNTIFVNGPDSIIDGRDGIDTVAYTRDRNEYLVDISDGNVTVLHRAATSNLTGDQIENVELFSFADGVYDLTTLKTPISSGVSLNEADVGGGHFRGTHFADTVFAVFYGALADLGDGDDIAVVLTGDSVLQGGAGDDRLFGGTGDSQIHGGAGDDILSGDGSARFFGGADRLDGGAGDDILMGGAGPDVFVFKPNEGTDVIGRFHLDANGAVVMNGVDFDLRIDKIQLEYGRAITNADLMAAITTGSDGAQFSLDGTAISIVGVAASDLTVDHFIFG